MFITFYKFYATAKKLIGGLIELDEAQSKAIKEMMKEYN